MRMTRVRVRRDRPSALAWAIALAITMLVVYLLTLSAGRPDVVESVSAAPRVTRTLAFEGLEAWCVSLCRCASPEEARMWAAGFADRGAAGCVAQLEGSWHVLGAAYASEREAARVAKGLKGEADIAPEVLKLSAEPLTLRITAPEAQIEAIAGADALLRSQTRQLGEIALQLDRGEIRPEAARTLCAVASAEAAALERALAAIPGAADNRLCAALLKRLRLLAELQDAVANSAGTSAAALSGMARCAQLENLIGQWSLQTGLLAG